MRLLCALEGQTHESPCLAFPIFDLFYLLIMCVLFRFIQMVNKAGDGVFSSIHNPGSEAFAVELRGAVKHWVCERLAKPHEISL